MEAKVSFGEVASFRNGLNYSRANFGQGLHVINVADFGDRFTPDYDQLREINPSGIANETSQLLDGDLLFVRSNGNKSLVGRVLLVKSPPYPVSYSGFCIRARVDKTIAIPEFYQYYFRNLQTHERLVAGGVGTNIVNISQLTLQRFLVPLPPIKVQQEIVEVLSRYDVFIETNRRRIALLEESAKLLYREWFIKLRFPGHELVKVVDGVPEGWAQLPLGDLANIVMGQSPESKYYNIDGKGLPFHQGVTNFDVRYVTDLTFTTKSTRIADAGDILCSVRAPVGRLNLTSNKIAIGRGLSAMRSKANHQSLLFYQLKFLFVEEDMIGGGAIFASVCKKELFNQQLLQPDKETSTKFNQIACEIDKQIETLILENRVLTEARDALLPKLMSGQLAV